MPLLQAMGSATKARAVRLAVTVPSTAKRAIQGDCSSRASNSSRPLTGLLMKITWPRLRRALSRAAGRPAFAQRRSNQGRVPPVGSSR